MHSNKYLFCALAVAGVLLAAGSVFATPEFRPGETWLDVDGQPIQAHGGGILVRDKTYYWYGEDRTPGGRGTVSCYSSTNLYDWKREGVALSNAALPYYYGEPTFVERPKVIYNPRTRKYVMWMHVEQSGYRYSCAGIATSDTPAGPFVFLKTIRPVLNGDQFPTNAASGENQFGAMFRDMNVFVDDNGKAYVFYAGEDNWTMYVARLNRDFTGPETPAVENKTWAKILVRAHREAPAPFKFRGRYYLITSACTGWAPNAADYSVAKNILGPYQSFGNPCVGTNADVTYGTQSTFVLPAPGQRGKFIFMADEWHPDDLPDSRHVWLPLILKKDGTFTLPWRDRWDLSVFKQKE
jgi:hypothetical protein